MSNKKIYSFEEIKEIINGQKNYLEEKYYADEFWLFGSYAKNMQTPDSDIDLLVNFKKPIDMFAFIDMQEYLSKIFNKKVDIGTHNSLKSFIKQHILNEAIVL